VHRDRVGRNVESAAEFFSRNAAHLSWVPPRGGTICFPRLLPGGDRRFVPGVERTHSPEPPSEEGAEAFCARVLRETGVLLLPSTVYDYGDEHFRLGLGRGDFAEGLNVLDAYLNDRRD
jgi:aspartate/methionine/tyrosine aminotransferase